MGFIQIYTGIYGGGGTIGVASASIVAPDYTLKGASTVRYELGGTPTERHQLSGTKTGRVTLEGAQ